MTDSISREQLFSALPEDTQAGAVRLDAQHVAEDAFPCDATGDVLATLETANALVLGGDFWVKVDGQCQPVYANWHYDGPDSFESIELARRTLDETWVSKDWYVSFVWR